MCQLILTISIRVAHLCVELSDVVSDLLLGFRFRFAGEYLAAFHSLLVKVPDDALPSSVRAAKNVAVGGESFLGHSWRFLLPGVLFNHQHYRTAFAYVQTYVLRFVEKNLPAFWWFYLQRWVGNFHGLILCLLPCNF